VQTGSGKTYTLVGPDRICAQLNQKHVQDDPEAGLVSRAVKYMFSRIKERKVACRIDVSFCEVYNEQVRDLLVSDDREAQAPLPVRFNPCAGFYVDGIATPECSSRADVMRLFSKGFKRTRVGSHMMNSRSNRSHTMFTINVHSAWNDDAGTGKRHGRICFVDLAGSERASITQAEGKTMQESGMINKSLFTLGKVISALEQRDSKRSKTTVVPYRDSTLTKLLMSSIGGTCKTLMITCCSPCETHVSETARTLDFACRAKNIKNKPIVVLDPTESLIQELRMELARLRKDNQRLHSTLQNERTDRIMRASSEAGTMGIPQRDGSTGAENRPDGHRVHGSRAPLGFSEEENDSCSESALRSSPSVIQTLTMKARHVVKQRRRMRMNRDDDEGDGSKDDVLMLELHTLISQYMHGMCEHQDVEAQDDGLVCKDFNVKRVGGMRRVRPRGMLHVQADCEELESTKRRGDVDMHTPQNCAHEISDDNTGSENEDFDGVLTAKSQRESQSYCERRVERMRVPKMRATDTNTHHDGILVEGHVSGRSVGMMDGFKPSGDASSAFLCDEDDDDLLDVWQGNILFGYVIVYAPVCVCVCVMNVLCGVSGWLKT
jgi:hypothetical protein